MPFYLDPFKQEPDKASFSWFPGFLRNPHRRLAYHVIAEYGTAEALIVFFAFRPSAFFSIGLYGLFSPL